LKNNYAIRSAIERSRQQRKETRGEQTVELIISRLPQQESYGYSYSGGYGHNRRSKTRGELLYLSLLRDAHAIIESLLHSALTVSALKGALVRMQRLSKSIADGLGSDEDDDDDDEDEDDDDDCQRTDEEGSGSGGEGGHKRSRAEFEHEQRPAAGLTMEAAGRMKKSELKQALQDRGLSTTGLKPELVQRLVGAEKMAREEKVKKKAARLERERQRTARRFDLDEEDFDEYDEFSGESNRGRIRDLQESIDHCCESIDDAIKDFSSPTAGMGQDNSVTGRMKRLLEGALTRGESVLIQHQVV
jgi:hypothetical protein